MPQGDLGQQITFAVEYDQDNKAGGNFTIRARKNDTIRLICARRGHPELVSDVLHLNRKHIRSATKKLKGGEKVILPGAMRKSRSLSVLADDAPPYVADGYAQFSTIQRVGTKGISQFTGFNPLQYVVPIQFEAYRDSHNTNNIPYVSGPHVVDPFAPKKKDIPFGTGPGAQIEQDIVRLEEFAGRGHYSGSAVGPPAVLRLSCTDSRGNLVHLIPFNYQWSSKNKTAPLWRISDLGWDQNPLRDDQGNRIRQACVVTLTEFTPITVQVRSVTQRVKAKHHHHHHKKSN